MSFKTGDWCCPRCSDHVFARKVRCRCGTPRPSSAPTRSAETSSRRTCDWICPRCSDHVFARKDRCRCGTPRPSWVPTSSDVESSRRAGDWDCASCSTMNFGSRTHCYRCQRLREHHVDADTRVLMEAGLFNAAIERQTAAVSAERIEQATRETFEARDQARTIEQRATRDAEEAERARLRAEAAERRITEEAEQRVREQVTELSASTSAASCSICLGNIVRRVVALPCGHTAFCGACLTQWVESGSQRCPECRSHIERIERIFA